MSMPFYASAEQIMRDRSEYARKNLARGRPVVVLKYVEGVVFVAENPSRTLHKDGSDPSSTTIPSTSSSRRTP